MSCCFSLGLIHFVAGQQHVSNDRLNYFRPRIKSQLSQGRQPKCMYLMLFPTVFVLYRIEI